MNRNQKNCLLSVSLTLLLIGCAASQPIAVRTETVEVKIPVPVAIDETLTEQSIVDIKRPRTVGDIFNIISVSSVVITDSNNRMAAIRKIQPE